LIYFSFLVLCLIEEVTCLRLYICGW